MDNAREFRRFAVKRLKGSAALFAGLAAVTPTTIMAQTAPIPTKDEAPAVTDSTQALEIVVTAQKKSEFSREVPIAVTALSGGQLAERNIARLTDLVAVVPNFTLSLAALQPITFVRGFGTTGSFSFEQDPMVAA